MTVRCVECSLFNLQKHPDMAKEGYGVCWREAARAGQFESATFPRQCEDFAVAPNADIQRRVAWLKSQRESAIARFRQLTATQQTKGQS